jgi:hypothetical protein
METKANDFIAAQQLGGQFGESLYVGEDPCAGFPCLSTSLISLPNQESYLYPDKVVASVRGRDGWICGKLGIASPPSIILGGGGGVLITLTQIRRHFHRNLEKFTPAEEFLQHLELPIRIVQE